MSTVNASKSAKTSRSETKPSRKNIIAATAPTEAKPISFVEEQRYAMIAEAAYYISEKNGFNPDLSENCWLEAEILIDAKLLEF